jgi:hypothetical protein
MEDLIPRWAEDLIWVEVDMSVFASNRLNMLEVRVGVYSVCDYQCGLIVVESALLLLMMRWKCFSSV